MIKLKEGHEIMCRAFEELYEQGIAQGIEQGAMREKINSVKSLIETLNLSLEEALAALKVSDSEKEYILENIDK